MLPVESTEDLRRELAFIDTWYDRLGEAGRDFIGTFKKIACADYYDPQADSIAAYYGVGLTKLTNAIIFGSQAVASDQESLFSIRTHEAIHALQAHVCAAIHADPVNKRSHVMLCPRDYIKLEELKERSAYGGQFLFTGLIHQLETGERKSVNFKIYDLPPEAEASIENIKRSMREKVDAVLGRDGGSLKDYYNEKALARYEEAMATDRAEELAHRDLVFARLEPEDIAAAGDGFTLNMFTNSEGSVLQTFMNDVPLSPELEARVRALNARLGITDEHSLPTFGQALAETGSDREQFLIASVTGAPSVPIIGPSRRQLPGPSPA